MAKDVKQPDIKSADAPSGAVAEDAALPAATPPDDANRKTRSGPQPKPAIEPSDIQGLKYFDNLKPLLARLHDVGTERDKAGNRELHMDEYCILQLLWMNTASCNCCGCSVPF